MSIYSVQTEHCHLMNFIEYMGKQKTHQASFAGRVLKWYHSHGRKDLPWQQDRTAYRVWVSEIMLQQTQVETVIPYFEKFMQRFPDLNTLADATEDEVLHHWSGLGYYARARNLLKTAKILCDQYAASFPHDVEQVNTLPGIGRSTAAAILAQAHGFRHAILDGNVKRVLTRFHAVEGWPGQNKVQAFLWQLAEQHTPDADLVDYTQGIMDLGATVCTRSRPHCDRCPLVDDCKAFHTLRTEELPHSKPKKSMPVKSARMLVLLNQESQVMLEKRPPTGIWGGLWSLPEMDLDGDISEYCHGQWQFEVISIEDKASFRHTFSHFHLDITPCHVKLKNPDQCVMEDERIVWYNTSQPDRLGLAAPIKTILKNLNEV